MNDAQPVEAERRSVAPRVDAGIFGRIVVPVDFSAGSRAALAVALELRLRFGSRVDVVHALSTGLLARSEDAVLRDDLLAEGTGRVHRFIESVTGARPEGVLAHALPSGDVVDGVVRAAEQLGATTIVVSSRARHGVLRSKAERIARKFPGVVLFVRARSTLGPASSPSPGAGAVRRTPS